MDVPGGDMLQKNMEQQAQINTNVQEEENAFRKPVDFRQIEKEKYANKFEKKTEEQLLQRNIEIQNNRQLATTSSRQRLIESAEELKNASQLLAQDKKWYRLFKWESSEMGNVKKSLHYLNNIMEQGVFSMERALLRETVNQAFITVLDACDTYITSHQNKAKHTVGKRRLARVQQIRKMAESEKDRFMIAANNYVTGMLDTTGMKTVRDLTSGTVDLKAKVSEYATHGDSSDVHRVLLKSQETEMPAQEKQIPENETEQEKYLRELAERDQANIAEISKHHLYVKEDDPLLNENFPSYLDRRINKLTISRQNKAAYGAKDAQEYSEKVKKEEAEIDELHRKISAGEMEEEEAVKRINEIRASQEELRLIGRLDDKDYELADKFLKTMKDGLSGGAKEAKLKRYVNFLGHDYNRVFADLAAYNAKVDELNADKTVLQQMLDGLKKEKDKPGVDIMIAALEKGLSGELHKMTGYEWIQSNAGAFGLDPEQDQDILNVLLELQRVDGEQKLDSERVARLFKRSLGKEAELFGQQRDRSGQTDSQTLASNNTASTRVAELGGFRDITTLSFKAFLTFQKIGQKGEETTTSLCTLSEEAEGDEMLELVEQAEKQGASLHFSPNAARQIIRLYMFDLICLQTDRHWRNFKCKVTKDQTQKPPQWTIESLKSFDHDQSFGPKDLKQYFVEKTDPNTGEKYTDYSGFLTPLMRTLDKKDPLYTFLQKTKMGGTNDKIMDLIKPPTIVKGTGMDISFSSTPFFSISRMRTFAINYERCKNQEKVVEYNSETKEFEEYEDHKGDDLYTYLKEIKNQNPGKESVAEEFIDVFCKLVNACSMEENGAYYLKDLTAKGDDEKPGAADVVLMLKKLKRLCLQLDLSKVDAPLEGKRYDFTRVQNGVFQAYLEQFMYMVKLRYGNDPETMKIVEKQEREEERQKIREKLQKQGNLQGKKLDEAVNKEFEETHEDTIRIPTLLHMDEEAYLNIKAMDENWDQVELSLMDLSWSKEKRDAFRRRIQQFVEQADEAASIVQKWAKQKGYPEGDIHGKFFLKPEDYEKIEDLTDLATDPSMSYFSIEDPNFLVGEKEYRSLLNETQVQSALELTNEMRAQERQKLPKLKEYKQMVSGKIKKSANSAMMKSPSAHLRN